jgi:hypothetical protein
LFLGTVIDNNIDRHMKGRNGSVKGERHGQSKLTDEQTREIRSSSASGAAMALKFGVARSTISMIRTNRNRRA